MILKYACQDCEYKGPKTDSISRLQEADSFFRLWKIIFKVYYGNSTFC